MLLLFFVLCVLITAATINESYVGAVVFFGCVLSLLSAILMVSFHLHYLGDS